MITIIGLGFVGLTTGLGFAKKGFKTYGLEINKARLQQLQEGVIPFHEPHLKEVLDETIGNTFILTGQAEEAIASSKYIFLCVGSPGKEDGSADLTQIFDAIDQILLASVANNTVLIIKSTVPPTTMQNHVKPYLDEKLKNSDRTIYLASNPEFLREGYCWEDFIEPDRIVIGIDNEAVKPLMEDIYNPFGAPIQFVNFNTAEFIKYLSNTLLSTMISYSNEMSMIAGVLGNIDIPKAFRILHQDKRWSGNPAAMSRYVYPGCGYGGYCLPKDTAAIHALANQHGFDAPMLKANLQINNMIKDHIIDKKRFDVPLNNTIGILGLSFKPGSDDVRFTPAKDIIERLLDSGFNKIIAYDPMANDSFRESYPTLPISYAYKLNSLLETADDLIILTGWDEFKQQKELLMQKNVYDYRYIF
jgi:UDPglucose 6-dehydrogenase